MRLAEAIADTKPEVRPSKVDRLLERLDDDDREQFVAMLHEPLATWSHERLARILSTVAGEYVSDNTVGKWRRDRGIV